jgi:hypothetical protein
MFDNWTTVHDIKWLNEYGKTDLAMAFIKVSAYTQHPGPSPLARPLLTQYQYGNEAEMDHFYSSAAIIARVPTYRPLAQAEAPAVGPHLQAGRSRRS